MDKLRFSHIPDDPHDAASYWFARERGGLMSAQEAEQFAQWCKTPENDQAYREMLAVWRVAQTVPDAALREIVATPAGEAAPASPVKRRHMRWSLAMLATMAVVGVTGHIMLRQQATFSQTYTTAAGQRRQFTLPDGSVVNLNTATTMTVRFYDDVRHVALESGEAVFSVAHNKDLPFIVDAGLGQVRVTGTLFQVRRDAQQLSVSVESGSVEVSRGNWRSKEKLNLVAGAGAVVSDTAIAAMPAQTDVVALSAWQQGKVVFDGTPLPRVVEEINRYRTIPIHMHGDFSKMQLAGVFSIDDTDTFLTILPTLIPVSVLKKENGTVIIMARKPA
jgi:transmembrane sensor